jgi:short-subunit dehydrogenase
MLCNAASKSITIFCFQESLDRFQKIDVLVLNHVLYEVKRWNAEQNYSEIATAFNVNVLSYIDLTTLFLSSLKASRGRLLVISSGLGLVTYPYFAMYCSSKHALHGFFNALRQDIVLEGDEMSITISVLGAVATDNAIRISSGNPVAGSNGWTRLSAVDASRVTVEASLHRERQIYFPNFLKIHQIASAHFPVFTEWLIRYVYNLSD